MTNPHRQGFHEGGPSRYHQGENFSQHQGQGWRSHSGNNFNKDQGGPSICPPNQGLNLYERTTKLEDTLTQSMQVSVSNHKSTESAIRNLEVQVGQLAKKLTETSIGSFVPNMEKNPKEECKVIFTRSQRRDNAEREKRDEGV